MIYIKLLCIAALATSILFIASRQEFNRVTPLKRGFAANLFSPRTPMLLAAAVFTAEAIIRNVATNCSDFIQDCSIS
jgi:hypothetical protein